MNKQTKIALGGAIALLTLIGGYVWYKKSSQTKNSGKKGSQPSTPSAPSTPISTISGGNSGGNTSGGNTSGGNSGGSTITPKSNTRLITTTRQIPASLGAKTGALNPTNQSSGNLGSLTSPSKAPKKPTIQQPKTQYPYYSQYPSTQDSGYYSSYGSSSGYDGGTNYGYSSNYGYSYSGAISGGFTYTGGGYNYGHGGLISG